MENNKDDLIMDFPSYFRCPISMELMKDPVTISTGITYERKNIEKWFFTYNNKTCPATMQNIENLIIVPNHNLQRLILSWKIKESCSSTTRPQLSINPKEMTALINAIDSSPFKVTCLRKLKSFLETGHDDLKSYFVKSTNGVEVVVKVVVQIVNETSDFATFEACEEALRILSKLSLSRKEKTFELLSKPESMKSMAVLLQKGSSEARFYAITILKKMAKKSDFDHWKFIIEDRGVDLFKSLLELVSDEICTKSSSYALEVMIQIMGSPSKNRLRAIEAGAVSNLIELIPDSNRSKVEKMLHIIRLLCKFTEGRACLVEHGMGIAVVSKNMMNVSNFATKVGVKILWLLCSNFQPRERVLKEMIGCGTVQKLMVLLHMGSGTRCSMKEKVIKIIKYLQASSWRNHPCFPSELKGFLKY